MDQPVKLTPLVCLQCSTPIPAQPEETAWVCAQCGQGMALDLDEGLVAMEVCYAANIPPGASGKPYWAAGGQVSLDRRSFGSAGKAGEQAAGFWDSPRRFFVPAYPCTLQETLARAAELLERPPDLQAGPPVPFAPPTLLREELQPTAEFIVAAIEAGRKDKLRQLDFSLQLQPAVLWILPAE